MFRFLEITPELLRAHAISRRQALELAGLTGLESALLPSEFVAERMLPMAENEGWIGFWILENASGDVIGSGGYKSLPVDGVVEIGYGIDESFWGQGAATVLCAELVRHAFAKGAQVVRAHTLEDGIASQRVLAKNGFGFVGKFIEPEDGEVLRFERTQ